MRRSLSGQREMSWRLPPGVVALAVVMIGVGGIVNWVHEGQKRERQVCVGSLTCMLARSQAALL